MKNNKNMWFVLLLFSICIINCKKDKKVCLDGFGSIDFEQLDIGCCLEGDISYIINDDSTYRSQLSSLGGNLPEIDFNEKILLGRYITGVGCDMQVDRYVCVDEEQKRLNYLINKKEKGKCDKLILSMNWILIDKKYNNYVIEISLE